jgi:hypothetical protein
MSCCPFSCLTYRMDSHYKVLLYNGGLSIEYFLLSSSMFSLWFLKLCCNFYCWTSISVLQFLFFIVWLKKTLKICCCFYEFVEMYSQNHIFLYSNPPLLITGSPMAIYLYLYTKIYLFLQVNSAMVRSQLSYL